MWETMQESLCSIKLREYTGWNSSSGEFNINVSFMMREILQEQEETARSYIDYLRARWEKWEVIAQATLAMRHIEDARMRYWKVIQYLWDWVSKFDK